MRVRALQMSPSWGRGDGEDGDRTGERGQVGETQGRSDSLGQAVTLKRQKPWSLVESLHVTVRARITLKVPSKNSQSWSLKWKDYKNSYLI